MLSRLIGNDNAKITLRRLIAGKRVPHSLLFAGDDGIGKRQFALELARSSLCTQLVDGEACGVCSACKRSNTFGLPKSDDKDAHKLVIRSEHPDLGLVIPYNRNILVDAIRHLEKEANFRPFEAPARIFIVDDADKMNDAASNALLKTLEEPASTSYIFLISSRPDSLLPTIRSRCQTIRFAPVDVEEIEQFLIRDRAFSHDEARIAAQLSRGSIGAAASMNVARFAAIRERMIEVLESALASGDLARLLKLSEEANDAKNKEFFDDTLDALEYLVRDVWRLAKTGDDSGLVNRDMAERLRPLAADAGRAERWLRDIEQLRSDLIVNVNKRVAADKLFLEIAAGR